jgi:hypothetical protein
MADTKDAKTYCTLVCRYFKQMYKETLNIRIYADPKSLCRLKEDLMEYNHYNTDIIFWKVNFL